MCFAPTQVCAYESHLIWTFSFPRHAQNNPSITVYVFVLWRRTPKLLVDSRRRTLKTCKCCLQSSTLKRTALHHSLSISWKPISPLRPPIQINIYFQRISPAARSTQGIWTTRAKEATKSHLLLSFEMQLCSMLECISSLLGHSLAEIVSGLS